MTVITVTFNCVAVIEKTICSVLSQSYAHLQYIIVDGGSTDGTLQIINRYAHRLGRLVSQPDGGIYDAMNKGVGMATGQWVNFLNAGDTFADERTVERFFAQLNDRTQIAYGNHIQELPFGRYHYTSLPLDDMSRGMIFCHQAAFVRTELLGESPFNCHYRLAADYDFFYRCFRNGAIFEHIELTVAHYDALQGASTDGRLRVWREWAQIRGIDDTLSWRIDYFLSSVKHCLKRGFDRLAPKLSARLKRRQYEQLPNVYRLDG